MIQNATQDDNNNHPPHVAAPKAGTITSPIIGEDGKPQDAVLCYYGGQAYSVGARICALTESGNKILACTYQGSWQVFGSC